MMWMPHDDARERNEMVGYEKVRDLEARVYDTLYHTPF